MINKKDGQLWLVNTKNSGDFDKPFLCTYRFEHFSGFGYVDVYMGIGNYDADDLVFIELIRDVDISIQEIQLEIHRLLIEACAIADEDNQILDVEIATEYLNRAGTVGANAIMDFRFEAKEK